MGRSVTGRSHFHNDVRAAPVAVPFGGSTSVHSTVQRQGATSDEDSRQARRGRVCHSLLGLHRPAALEAPFDPARAPQALRLRGEINAGADASTEYEAKVRHTVDTHVRLHRSNTRRDTPRRQK